MANKSKKSKPVLTEDEIQTILDARKILKRIEKEHNKLVDKHYLGALIAVEKFEDELYSKAYIDFNGNNITIDLEN